MMRNAPRWPLLRLAMTGQKNPDPQIREVSETIIDWWLSGGEERLDRSVGTVPAPGQRSSQTQVQMTRRDELVRTLASEHFPELRSHPAAVAIRKQWSRYAASAWSRERLGDSVPKHRVGKPEAMFWQIMKIQDRVLSERSIRKILAAS